MSLDNKDESQEIQEEEKEKKEKKFKKAFKKKVLPFLKKHLKAILFCIVIIFVIVGTYFAGVNSVKDSQNASEEVPQVEHEEKISELSLKNIGKLETQQAYVTVVETMEDARKILGKEIIGTHSILIFSHDFEITAGYNFEEIKADVVEKTEDSKGTITIALPEAEIMHSGIISDSEEVYYENESIFKKLDEKEKAELRAEMGEEAEQIAINNGLLVNAKDNAKKILTNFIYNMYSSADYEIIFTDTDTTE